MHGRVLTIGGSDSGGGAGIQADIKTVTALGGFSMTAITALTAQNTKQVGAIHPVPPTFVADQMRLVLADLGADCLKTGMMYDGATVEAVSDVLDKEARGIPLVIDPVLVSKSGAALFALGDLPVFKARLVLRGTLITPNISEAEMLTGLKIASLDDMIHAAEMLRTMGPPNALLKGGHMPGDNTVIDVLATDHGIRLFHGPRIKTTSTHGTGCTLASAIASGLAQGLTLEDAIARARAYLEAALKAAPGLGGGNGPLNHAITVQPFSGRAASTAQ
ncbi:MAG: bifunctional hydroxymethylpyrimidine kinase/phosphomethylpyrimidine kinase [Alphaproteobacteria bacterium]|nr:bifunctional hydroxymethylpyrimidine kinase/phosphomethylpyrimidine kinase [Alphaproteobacteria bacterium]